MEKHRCEIKRYGSQGNEPCVLTGIVKKVKQVYLKKAFFICELAQTFLYENVIDVMDWWFNNNSVSMFQSFQKLQFNFSYIFYLLCCLKFIYSEKATKFYKISTNYLTGST